MALLQINNLFQLNEILQLENRQFVETLQEANLLRTTLRCRSRNCRRQCTLQQYQQSALDVIFRCPGCRRRYSVLRDSFFERQRRSIREVLYMMFIWACEVRVGIVRNLTGLPGRSIVQQYRFFRDICSWKISQEESLFLLGGPGVVVQIAESAITKRTCLQGRVIPEKWVLGMFDIATMTGYIVYVPDRRAPTLIREILAHVRAGSIIWTDRWVAYRQLGNLGGASPYEHHMVNHSRLFVDPDTGDCRNFVERYWPMLRQYLRRFGVMSQSNLLPEYINQFLWARAYGQSSSHRFRNMILHISERYPLAR